MELRKSTYNVGYPVYGAKYLKDDILLVTGGGGDGRYESSTPNKITALRIDFKKKKVIKRFREITLDARDAAPTTLDAQKDTILIGCNESMNKIESGHGNHHLRKFVYANEHLKFLSSIDFYRSTDPNERTKFIYITSDAKIAAVASTKTPTVIRVIDLNDLHEKYEVETKSTVTDLHFSPNGKMLAYITTTSLEVISLEAGEFIVRKTDFNNIWNFSHIRFLDNENILLVSSNRDGSGITLIKIPLKKNKIFVTSSKVITTEMRYTTAIDVDKKSQVIALSGDNNSVLIINANDLKVMKEFANVHDQVITAVSFSPNSKYLGTVSIANTVQVIELPKGRSFLGKVFKFLFNVIFMVFLAYLAQIGYKYDIHLKIYDYLDKKFLHKLVSPELLPEIQTTTLFNDDMVTVSTFTKPLNTDDSSIETATHFTPISSETSPMFSQLSHSTVNSKSTPEFIKPTSIETQVEHDIPHISKTVKETPTKLPLQSSHISFKATEDLKNAVSLSIVPLSIDADEATTESDFSKVSSRLSKMVTKQKQSSIGVTNAKSERSLRIVGDTTTQLPVTSSSRLIEREVLESGNTGVQYTTSSSTVTSLIETPETVATTSTIVTDIPNNGLESSLEAMSSIPVFEKGTETSTSFSLSSNISFESTKSSASSSSHVAPKSTLVSSDIQSSSDSNVDDIISNIPVQQGSASVISEFSTGDYVNVTSNTLTISIEGQSATPSMRNDLSDSSVHISPSSMLNIPTTIFSSASSSLAAESAPPDLTSNSELSTIEATSGLEVISEKAEPSPITTVFVHHPSSTNAQQESLEVTSNKELSSDTLSISTTEEFSSVTEISSIQEDVNTEPSTNTVSSLELNAESSAFQTTKLAPEAEISGSDQVSIPTTLDIGDHSTSEDDQQTALESPETTTSTSTSNTFEDITSTSNDINSTEVISQPTGPEITTSFEQEKPTPMAEPVVETANNAAETKITSETVQNQHDEL